MILAALGGRFRLVEATRHDDAVLAAVHDAGCSEFLAYASERWAQGPYAELVGQDRVVPYFFPTPALTRGCRRRRRWPCTREPAGSPTTR